MVAMQRGAVNVWRWGARRGFKGVVTSASTGGRKAAGGAGGTQAQASAESTGAAGGTEQRLSKMASEGFKGVFWPAVLGITLAFYAWGVHGKNKALQADNDELYRRNRELQQELKLLGTAHEALRARLAEEGHQ